MDDAKPGVMPGGKTDDNIDGIPVDRGDGRPGVMEDGRPEDSADGRPEDRAEGRPDGSPAVRADGKDGSPGKAEVGVPAMGSCRIFLGLPSLGDDLGDSALGPRGEGKALVEVWRAGWRGEACSRVGWRDRDK